jgi:hypothetical protein
MGGRKRESYKHLVSSASYVCAVMEHEDLFSTTPGAAEIRHLNRGRTSVLGSVPAFGTVVHE